MALATSLGGRWRLLPALALAVSLLAVVPQAGAATAKPAAATVVPPQMASSAAIGRAPRIIGGSVVTAPDGWPWIVSIRRSGETSNRCGGTVIAADLILTAAHCVYDNGSLMPPSALYVVARQHLLQPITGEVLQVAKIVPHPSFETVTYGGDAALLFLRTATTAPAMVMADFALETAALGSGATDFAAGWGSTLPWSENAAGEIVSSPSYPNELMQTQLDLFTADACNGAFSPTRTFWSAWHLCAGRLPMTTCNGDSGGTAPRAAEQWPVGADRYHVGRVPRRRRRCDRLLQALRRHHPRRGRQRVGDRHVEGVPRDAGARSEAARRPEAGAVGEVAEGGEAPSVPRLLPRARQPRRDR